MARERYWSTSDARKYALSIGVDLTKPTIIRYIQAFNLGHKIGGDERGRWGRWLVNIQKWKRFLEGEFNVEKKSCFDIEEEY